MNNEILVDKLIEYFINENESLRKYSIPKVYEEKRNFLRGIINIRDHKEIPDDILKLEDELLQLELKEKNIVDSKDISPLKDNMCIWRGDITTIKVDAIVNAANSALLECFLPNHLCIDNQIHTYAGIRLRLKCNDIMKGKKEKTADAKITPGYNLPSKYVIHTVGPIVYDKLTEHEKKQLEECYISCLSIARENNIKTIAFPAISTGVFRFPKDIASKIAVETVSNYLKKYPNSFEKVIFNVYSLEDESYYDKLLRN